MSQMKRTWSVAVVGIILSRTGLIHAADGVNGATGRVGALSRECTARKRGHSEECDKDSDCLSGDCFPQNHLLHFLAEREMGTPKKRRRQKKICVGPGGYFPGMHYCEIPHHIAEAFVRDGKFERVLGQATALRDCLGPVLSHMRKRIGLERKDPGPPYYHSPGLRLRIIPSQDSSRSILSGTEKNIPPTTVSFGYSEMEYSHNPANWPDEIGVFRKYFDVDSLKDPDGLWSSLVNKEREDLINIYKLLKRSHMLWIGKWMKRKYDMGRNQVFYATLYENMHDDSSAENRKFDGNNFPISVAIGQPEKDMNSRTVSEEGDTFYAFFGSTTVPKYAHCGLETALNLMRFEYAKLLSTKSEPNNGDSLRGFSTRFPPIQPSLMSSKNKELSSHTLYLGIAAIVSEYKCYAPHALARDRHSHVGVHWRGVINTLKPIEEVVKYVLGASPTSAFNTHTGLDLPFGPSGLNADFLPLLFHKDDPKFSAC